ncbi:hypothetical protein BD310DRAFT_826822, partial [Dichomitus squalens]
LYDVEDGSLSQWGLRINRRLRCFICIDCQTVVCTSKAAKHIEVTHAVTKIQVDKDLLNSIISKENLILEWPEKPTAICPAYAGLPTAYGLLCPTCGEMFSTPKSVNKHSNEKHNVSTWNKVLEEAWMQRFSQHPLAKSWFPVYPFSAQSFNPPSDYLVTLRQQLDQRPALDSDQIDVRHINPWLITTGWQTFTHDHSAYAQPILIDIPQQPSHANSLDLVRTFVYQYLERAYILIPRTSEICRQILNTDTLTDTFNHTPFHMHQDPSSFTNCQRLLTQLILYLLRTRPSPTHPLPLPNTIVALLDNLIQALDTASLTLHALLVAIWTTEWIPSPFILDGNVKENPIPDPTVRFIVCTQMNQDGTLKDPRDVTGVLAKLTYCMRLVFLKQSWNLHSSDPHLSSVTAAARSLRLWFTEGSESTFHTIRTLQHRASAITMSTQNEPNMKWKDDSNFTSLIFKGHEVSLEKLATQAAALEDYSRQLLTEVLLFDHPFFIDISQLKDDMGNSTPGYSLFTDRANEPVLGFTDQLTQHILDTPSLRSRFILSTRDGEIQWNAIALGAWLSNYAKLDLLCLVQVEMNCGAPPRTTELTAMARCNTLYGMLRAIRIIDGHVVLMRSYHKMRTAQGHDRVIPHSLNAALAALLIYKEALCHPFAQLCVNVLYPNDRYVKSLYQNFLFINHNKPFVGDDITQEMRNWTKQYIGYELGVRDWRQVSTPLRRQHAGLQEKWLEDQETADAAQAGHSHHVDHMRYGVTARGSTSLAEDYLDPFLETSVRWHATLKLVPGGKLISLDAASHHNFQPPTRRHLSTNAGQIDVAAIVDAVAVKVQDQLAALKQDLATQATANHQALLTSISALLGHASPQLPVPLPEAVPITGALLPSDQRPRVVVSVQHGKFYLIYFLIA